MDKPELSVIIVTLVGVETLRRCLAALQRQEGGPAMEIIVPADENLGETAALQADFPDARFLPVNGRRTYAELRAIGVRQAQGSIIAITEDHCLPNPNWCKQIRLAHQRPYAAIGGPVEKKIPDAALNWAIYFADYLRYMGPMQEGPTHELTDLNVTYKRAALDKIAALWAVEFHENVVHAALEAAGETLWASPQIVVHQQRSIRLKEALWDRYAFGRLFASTRVKTISPAKRLAYAASSVLIPFLLTARLVALIRRKRRWQGEFWRAFPLILLVNTTWAMGEMIGALTGRPAARLASGGREAAGISQPPAT